MPFDGARRALGVGKFAGLPTPKPTGDPERCARGKSCPRLPLGSRVNYTTKGHTMAEQLDQELVGTIGLVTLPIAANRSGEVVLPVRGGTEAFSALCDEPVPRNARVVVVECLSGRTVMVTPCS
jgi:hypothetical protein